MAHEIIPALRRVAAAETFAISLGEVAAAKQLAGGQCFLGQDLGDEEALGFLAGFQQSRALGAGVLARRAVAAVLVVQLDMVLVGEQFHGFAEVDVFGLFDVFEYVATQAAAEAVPHAERGTHVEAAGFLVVERAQATKVPVPEGLSVTVADTMSYRSAGGAHLLDIFFLNHSDHKSLEYRLT